MVTCFIVTSVGNEPDDVRRLVTVRFNYLRQIGPCLLKKIRSRHEIITVGLFALRRKKYNDRIIK